MSPAPGAKDDPIRRRCIKVFHVGFQQSAFMNNGACGTVTVRIIGGAIALLQFTARNKPGLYLPTVALLRDPDNLASGDGSSYTFTIVVK